MSECSEYQSPITNSFEESLLQLQHSIWEMEKVNVQFFQLLELLNVQAPCQPILQHSATDPQQPQPCLAPQHDHTLQHILPQVLPPAPNPQASPLQPTAHYQITHGSLPLVQHPAPTIIPCKFPWPPPTKQTTIPNWEKPSIPPPASNPVTGKFCVGKNPLAPTVTGM